jgi:hypothetical protein
MSPNVVNVDQLMATHASQSQHVKRMGATSEVCSDVELHPERPNIKDGANKWSPWFLDLPAMERKAILRAHYPEMGSDDHLSLQAEAKRHKLNAAQARLV